MYKDQASVSQRDRQLSNFFAVLTFGAHREAILLSAWSIFFFPSLNSSADGHDSLSLVGRTEELVHLMHSTGIEMIDFGIEREVPTRDLIRELIGLLEPMANRLDTMAELAHIETILERGTSADAQINVWNKAEEDFHTLVDYIVKETENIA